MWIQNMTTDDWQAVGRLALGAGFIPLAATFFALIVAGQMLTPKGEHTRLGNALALFCDGVGIIFVCLAILTIARWYDLDPAGPDPIIGLWTNIVGLAGLLAALVAAHIAGPIIISRILHRRAGGGYQDGAGLP